MTKLPLNSAWLLRLEQYSRLFVGYSGGLDSTVLLHVLSSHPSLRPKLVAVHINHGISPNALDWQQHCEQFCQQVNIPLKAHSVCFTQSANLEEQAREARYTFFSSLLESNDGLLIGHHQDDQAETVLLQLFRGAGIDGLCAMQEIGQLGVGTLLRPFLSYSRAELQDYAELHQLQWIDDESNNNTKYSRNYLRNRVIPLLKERWPGVVGNLARTAAHCEQAKTNLEELARGDSHGLDLTAASLPLNSIKTLNEARLTNVIRLWLRKNQVLQPSSETLQRIIHEVCFAKSDAMPIVCWDAVQIRRYQQTLYLDQKQEMVLAKASEWLNFPLALDFVSGQMRITAKKANTGLFVPENTKIAVGFRQGGERFLWHGQTKQLKKLFQEWGVAPWLRDRIPLIYINETLAAVVGYAINDLFFTSDPSQAWLIEYSVSSQG